MRKTIYLSTLFVGLIALISCEKDPPEIPFDDVLSKPYTTGIVKLQHQVITNGGTRLKDTTVTFTSIGNNPADKDDYGYSKPSNRWAQLIRINPDDFQNRASVLFVNINLDSLSFPHKFQAGDTRNAQVVYKTGPASFYDANGNLIQGNNEYGGGTYWDEFELTILSRVNNRLQGTFSGILRNHDALPLNIKKGLFDVEIVNK